MRQPSTPSAAAPSASETVTRPEPGLGRGAWEAPPWALWTLLGVVVVGATLYLLFRLGVLRPKRQGR